MIEKTERSTPWKVTTYGTDDQGKRKRSVRYFSTYNEAKDYENRNRISKKRNTKGSNSKIEIEGRCADFCEKRKDEIRISSIDSYKRTFRLYVIPFFHGLDRKKVVKEDFVRWKDHLQEMGLSYSSCKVKYNSLHGLLSFAYREYGRDIVKYLDRAGSFKRDPNAIINENERNFWDTYQFAIFIECFKKHCLARPESDCNYIVWWGCYVRLNILFFAGLRKGEANALTPSDFVQRRGIYYLNIIKSCSHKIQGYGWVTTPPKNKFSKRSVPIPKKLVDIIKEHLYTRLNRLGEEPKYLCGGLNHIADSTLIALKDRVEEEAHVPHIRIHDLRHSYVSVLINANTPITTISKLVGHSSTEITWKVYSHLYPDTLASAVSAFDNSVCGNAPCDNYDELGGVWVASQKNGTKF